ncbi:hypothetical protein [Sulfitobacter sp. R86518]|uniref:hypothetical protein n=1 Tax=Sulfitobacter sp. R86518 TaxID=3093858 RepID=UPI0036DC70C3
MSRVGTVHRPRKQKAEDCISLSIEDVHRSGRLRPGSGGCWSYFVNGIEVSRVGYRAEFDRFILEYKARKNGGDWEHVTLIIAIARTRCHFGGTRPYFICPSVKNRIPCGRRVGRLYSVDKYFFCRHCANVTYTSQTKPSHERKLRQASKIRASLGGEPGMAKSIPPRPKGMWQQTYRKKRSKIERYESQADYHFLSKFDHLLSAEEREMFLRPDTK